MFDSNMLLDTYKSAVKLSLAGPFASYWISLMFAFKDAEENKFWERWQMWTGVATWFVFTMCSMITQGKLVPYIIYNLDIANEEENANEDEDDFAEIIGAH